MTVIHSGRHVVIPSLLQVRTFAPKTAAAIVWPPVDDWWSVSGKTCVAEVDWETAQRWGMRGPLHGVTVRIVTRQIEMPEPLPARPAGRRAVAY